MNLTFQLVNDKEGINMNNLIEYTEDMEERQVHGLQTNKIDGQAFNCWTAVSN